MDGKISKARELARIARKATFDPDDMLLVSRAKEIADVLESLANKIESTEREIREIVKPYLKGWELAATVPQMVSTLHNALLITEHNMEVLDRDNRELRKSLAEARTAVNAAVRAPMGVVPDEAVSFYDQEYMHGN